MVVLDKKTGRNSRRSNTMMEKMRWKENLMRKMAQITNL